MAQKRTKKENFKEILRSTFIGLSFTGICTAVLTGTIFLLSLLVKGKGIWIIPNRTYFQYFPLLSLNFWCSLVIAAFVLFFLADKTADLKKFANTLLNSISLRKQPSLAKETGSNLDPLDFTTYVSSFLMAAGTYIYETIEHGSIENMIKGIRKVFYFLFAKVEKFISADLWLHALRSVIDSSHRVQRMHTGFLRVNLVWLLLFIVILVLIAVSPNIGSIFSTG